MSANHEREMHAVCLLADLLRRVNQAYDVLDDHLVHSNREAVNNLSDQIIPTMQILRDDIERIAGEAEQEGLINGEGEEQFGPDSPTEATP